MLIAALKDSDKRVRQQAALALATVSDNSGISVLVDTLRDGHDYNHYDVEREAMEALVKIGQPAVLVLIAAFKNSSAAAVSLEVDTLTKIGQPAVPALLTALSDNDHLVYYSAATALGRIGGKTGDKTVVSALKAADRKYHHGHLCCCDICAALYKLGAK